jgi:hypothetical protein
MTKGNLDSQSARHKLFALRCVLRLLTPCLLIIFVSQVHAVSMKEYHAHVRQAVTALDSMAQVDETEDAAAYASRRAETVKGVRILLPAMETVEWDGTSFSVDNSWLHHDLDKYGSAKDADRAELLKRITERLQAIAERLAETENPGSINAANKSEQSRKLAEILQRPEYARKVKGESFISSLLNRFLKWLLELFPKPKPFSPGSAGIFSQIAQVFVIVLALAVLAFVAKLFLPRLLRSRRTKKKEKKKARIVLGEKLEPDQSATDLLAEAELLARRGDLRAAIRKAYIALLVELGERKIIHLAQHKTNRDYLKSVREDQRLYGNVKQLTDSFERHWYGFAQANETDWLTFRAAYEQTLTR